MGYYSNLSIDADPYIHDASITPPEQQLLWRLDDLRDLFDNAISAYDELMEKYTDESLEPAA